MHLEGSCRCGAVAFSCEAYAPVPFLRCYCSICRKTAGGGGYAINLGSYKTGMQISGRAAVGVFRARIASDGRTHLGSGRRHFCRRCGTALWLWDPEYPDLVHPFASAIDTPLPRAPERVHMMLASRAAWVEVPRGRHDVRFDEYPDESLEAWHRRHGLFDAGARAAAARRARGTAPARAGKRAPRGNPS